MSLEARLHALRRVAADAPANFRRYELLLAAEAGPYGSEFESSLALAGMDGTMRRRFRGEDMAGHMHLKTGTLNNVRAVAGYVQTPAGRKFAVTVIQNSSGWGEDAQNALLRWVYRQ